VCQSLKFGLSSHLSTLYPYGRIPLGWQLSHVSFLQCSLVTVVSWRLYVTLISSMNKLDSATANHIITYFETHSAPFMNLAFVLRLVVTQQGTVQPNI
jgi:hypothetical protein